MNDPAGSRHIASQSLRELEAIFDHASLGILFTKDRRITRCNEKFCEMFGFGGKPAIGVEGRALFVSDGDYAEVGRLAAPLLSAGQPFTHEIHMARQDGRLFWAQLMAYVLDPATPAEGTVWLISDRSHEKRQDEAVRMALLESQAILDNVVIGIVILNDRIVQRCNPYAEQLFGFEPGAMVGTSTRLWYANPDDFEAVGEDFYPTLTTTRAHTTEIIFRRQSGEMFWGRMSGRIFDGANPLKGGSIWVIEDTSQRHAAESALRSATALTGAVFNSANVSIIATSTAGTINLINTTAQRWLGYTAEELVGKATPAIIHDEAEVVARSLDLSREMGMQIMPGFDVFVAKARVHGSDEREWTYIRKDGSRFQIENALRYALSLNELSLHYQPLMDMRANTVFGVEALLRWKSKTLGELSPAQFIPIAEESGLIVPIGTWVLREACIQVKQWRESCGQDYMLAVNLSPQQFRQPDLAAVVATILAETGFPARALELEITESSLMHNVSDVIATLHQLVELGVRLAIDDFGTGYSSLAYLRHFPVHKLKIDQSFVRDIGQDDKGLGIVSTIISLAATLNLEVIAEGVETQPQMQELVQQGCHFLQGYFFSRPLPVPDAKLFLVQNLAGKKRAPE